MPFRRFIKFLQRWYGEAEKVAPDGPTVSEPASADIGVGDDVGAEPPRLVMDDELAVPDEDTPEISLNAHIAGKGDTPA